MALSDRITLSKKSMATVERFPEFFEPALNALYDLHLKHGYRKPKLSVYRDESTVVFNGKNHAISIMYLASGQLVIGDSRRTATERYETVKLSHEELATTLFDILQSWLPSLVSVGTN